MADAKISSLAAAGNLATTDKLVVARAGTTLRVDGSQIGAGRGAAVGYLGSLMAETMPPYAIQHAQTLTKGRPFGFAVWLEPGDYTTVKIHKATVAGTSLANCFFAIYDVTSLSRLAISANIAASLGSLATQTIGAGFTLNYTVTTAGWYWLVLLLGTSTTAVPTFWGVNAQSDAQVLERVGQRYQCNHNATSLDALPDPLVLSTSLGGLSVWMQYHG